MMQLSTLKNGRATTDLAYVLPESHKQMYGTIKYVLVFYESNWTTFLHVSKCDLHWENVRLFSGTVLHTR